MTTDMRPLTGLMQWERVDTLIERIKSIGPWHIHSPAQGLDSLFVAQGDEAALFLAEQADFIKERYRSPGWVYVHTPDAPSWIKIYDPSKCAGCSIGLEPPKAWWEMELEDPRKRIPPEPSPSQKKALFEWFRKKK